MSKSDVETCGIIPPRASEVSGIPTYEYLPECILPEHHDGPHMFQTPDGKYTAWQDDWGCGCCEPDEEDRCTVHWKVSKKNARKLLKKRVK